MPILRSATLLATLVTVAACGSQAAEPSPRTHVVEIRGFEFHPALIQVSPGDSIVWVNRDAVPHTATATAGDWDSGSIAGGASWSRVAEGGGEIMYYCAFHPSMRGQITLE